MMVEKVPDSTYDMIGGLDEQIKQIKEVIELGLKHPELFESLGIAQPKGVLLYGPPGTGKTLLARAVAHHTDCKFIRVSGSELVQKYIGEGSRMVRELFVMAREHAPSIIFMDEIDAALDFRNVSIVANYIKDRTKNAQFIIISLRLVHETSSDSLFMLIIRQERHVRTEP